MVSLLNSRRNKLKITMIIICVIDGPLSFDGNRGNIVVSEKSTDEQQTSDNRR